MKAKTQTPDGLREAAEPHFHGHRQRLRERFMEAGAGALADYELIELVLFRAIPRRDVKPLAKALIARFGSFAEVVAARPERLREIEGLGEAAICEIKLMEAAGRRLARGEVEKRRARPPSSRSSTIAMRRWPTPSARSSACFSSTNATG